MDNYIGMYEKLPNLVLGFHGCDLNTYDNVLVKHQELKKSANSYDWLGNGIYFWENSFHRAYDWAEKRYGQENAAVIGAVIDLGFCLNLTDYHSSDLLRRGYQLLKTRYETLGYELPKNGRRNKHDDVLLRDLDCAVIQQLHEYNLGKDGQTYDSVRGVFLEGKEVYPGAEVREKTHIQLCIVNPNCIKGLFSPREMIAGYRMP